MLARIIKAPKGFDAVAVMQFIAVRINKTVCLDETGQPTLSIYHGNDEDIETLSKSGIILEMVTK